MYEMYLLLLVTFVLNFRVSHKSPVSRLEQNSLHNTHRQCPQLRSTLFYSARNCFLVLKSATTNLVTGYVKPIYFHSYYNEVSMVGKTNIFPLSYYNEVSIFFSVQWRFSKPNLLWVNFCVRIWPLFVLYRLN